MSSRCQARFVRVGPFVLPLPLVLPFAPLSCNPIPHLALVCLFLELLSPLREETLLFAHLILQPPLLVQRVFLQTSLFGLDLVCRHARSA